MPWLFNKIKGFIGVAKIERGGKEIVDIRRNVLVNKDTKLNAINNGGLYLNISKIYGTTSGFEFGGLICGGQTVVLPDIIKNFISEAFSSTSGKLRGDSSITFDGKYVTCCQRYNVTKPIIKRLKLDKPFFLDIFIEKNEQIKTLNNSEETNNDNNIRIIANLFKCFYSKNECIFNDDFNGDFYVGGV